MERRIVVIALDGASPQLIEGWAREGHLPSLAALIERGAFGPLTSVVPPVTGAAWGSFLTGLSPGRHGVFEWLSRKDGSYHLGLIDSSALRGPTLFEWLSLHGVRVGAVGVPLTYPIRPVEGFMVSDLLTPPGKNYTYPSELQAEIESVIGSPYPLAPPPWPGRPRARRWLKELKESLKVRAKAILHLAAHHSWDFLMVHVMETDSIQHQMWHLLDGVERPRYRLELEGSPILEIYREADGLVGRLMESLEDEAIVFVISDHGFGPLHYNLHINTWLLRHGFLRLKGNPSSRLKALMFEAGLTPEGLYPWEERLRLLGWARGEQAYRWLGRLSLSMQNIDWQRTYAYSYGNVGQIYLNLKGREPEGIVTEAEAPRIIEELEDGLLGWKNTLASEPERVVEKVYRKEEVYGERALFRAPELVFLPEDGYSPMGLSEFLSNKTVSYPVAHSGWHRMEGVFLGAGGPLRRGYAEGLRLIDLFPTICQLLGVPTPPDLDGRVAERLLSSKGRVGHRSHALQWPKGAVSSTQRSLTKSEEEEIRERLKGLGYL